MTPNHSYQVQLTLLTLTMPANLIVELQLKSSPCVQIAQLKVQTQTQA